MFEEILKACEIFRQGGFEDSLTETLRLFDLLSDGIISKMETSQLEREGLDMKKIVEMRKKGIPMEYIVGKAHFMGLTLYCTPDTLIPRLDTVLLVETALRLIEEGKKASSATVSLIEVGTGCGNIAIAIAINDPSVRIHACDIDPAAIRIASKNIEKFDLQDRIALLCGDLLDPFDSDVARGKIDLIVCNPPYIPTSSLQKLDRTIIDHEPVLALDGGSYGIDIFRRLIKDAASLLKEGGFLLFEIGAGQEGLVTRLLQKNGNYNDIRHYKYGKDVRVVAASKKSLQ